MHKDQGQVHSAVESCSWRKLIHQPLLLDYPEEGCFFFFWLIGWLVGWLVISFTSSKKSDPGVSCDQPVQVWFWHAPLAHRLGLKSGLSLYFSLTEVPLWPHRRRWAEGSRALRCSLVWFASAWQEPQLPAFCLSYWCAVPSLLRAGTASAWLSELDDISKLLPEQQKLPHFPTCFPTGDLAPCAGKKPPWRGKCPM